MASNYEVNIKLDTKQATNALKSLEDRIAKLNKLALRGKASKQILKQDRDALALKIRENRVQDQKIKKDRLELKIAKDNLRIQQQSANIANGRAGGFNRSTGGSANKGGGGRSGVLSGALISGAFPLLFGQGPLGAAAGFGGGLIGGAIGGQMGGFAGGLVATALLQTVTNTVNGINELGAALNDPTQNLDKLVTNLSKFDRNISASVQILQSAGLTAAAGQYAKARFGMQYGDVGSDSLEEMNKAFKEFGKVTARLGTELAILASGPLTGFMKVLNFILGGGEKGEGESLGDTINNTIRDREIAIEKVLELEASLQEKIERRAELAPLFDTKEKERQLAEEGKLGKIYSEYRRLGGEISADTTDLEILRGRIENFEEAIRLAQLQQKILKETEVNLRSQLEIEQNRFGISEKELIVLEQRNKIKKLEFAIEKQIAEVEAVKKNGSKLELERAEQTLKNLRLQLDLEEQITLNRLNAADPAINRMNELNEKMRDLNDTTLQAVNLSKAMGESFKESFKGIVKGTMTVQDAFRNMLNRIADFFLDTAAQMAANQLQQSILGMFGNMFNFNTTPLNDIQNTPVYAANGGPVGYKNPYIVGERGPELFVPNQSGNIIPNHDLAGVGGGSTSIVVNVDASGTSVEGNEANGEELGRLIGAVVQSELIKEKRPGGLLA